MSQLLEYANDVQGAVSPALPLPTYIQSAIVPTASRTMLTVPNDYANWVVLFEYGADADVWVSVNHTAQPPASGIFADGNCLLNPQGLRVLAGDVVTVYNNGANSISVCAALYGLF